MDHFAQLVLLLGDFAFESLQILKLLNTPIDVPETVYEVGSVVLGKDDLFYVYVYLEHLFLDRKRTRILFFFFCV